MGAVGGLAEGGLEKMLWVVATVGRGLETRSSRESSGGSRALGWWEQGKGGREEDAGKVGGGGGAGMVEGLGYRALRRTPRCRGVCGFRVTDANGEGVP